MDQHQFPASVAAIISEARRQQEQARQSARALDAAVAKLIDATDGMQALAIEQVRNALVSATASAANEISQPWQAATAEANKASAAFRRAAVFMPGRLFGGMAFCVLAGLAGMVLTAKVILPDWDELVALRQERAALVATIELIGSKGANVDVIGCRDLKNRQRLCARIDDQAGRYANGYRALKVK